MAEHNGNIIPLYAARVEHLVHAPTVAVRCACGHAAKVAVEVIRERLPDHFPIKNLERKFRCLVCNRVGAVTVNARAALGYDRP